MTFTPNIPTTGQSLGNTRDAIRNNFTNYNNVISENHYAPNDANEGKHKYLQMPEEAADPATAVNEGAVYVKQGTGTVAQLFWRNENNGIVQQLTGNFDAGNQGSIEFFGFKIKWGFQNVNPNTNTTITFVNSLGNPDPFSTACYVVIPSAGASVGQNAESASIVGTPNVNSFVVRTSAGATVRKVTYIAIGQ